MKRGIRKIFLAIGFLAVFPLVASADQGEVVNCFDYYKFQSVNMNVGPDKPVYMPGESVRFSGELTNENSYPVVDGYVFIRVSRPNENYRQDGHFIVNEFIALDKVVLDAKETKQVSFDWNVPEITSGDYRADYFFSVGKKYNLGGLPFSNEVTIGSAEFKIISETESRVSFVRSETKVNGQKYNHIGSWPIIEPGAKAEIVQPLENTFAAPQPVTITYDLYWWDSLNEKDKLDSKTEKITIPADATSDLSYTVPEMKDSVYMLKITANADNQKSIVNIRLVSDQEHPRLNYPGISKFPLQKGDQSDLFSCFHNTAGMGTAGTVKLALTDKQGKPVGGMDYQGTITGEMMAAKKTISITDDLSWLKLTATLQDKDGKTLETYESVYDCEQLNSQQCRDIIQNQIAAGGSRSLVKLLGIIFIGFLVFISLVIIILKKKNRTLVFFGICFISYTLLAGAFHAEASCLRQKSVSVENVSIGWTGPRDCDDGWEGYYTNAVAAFPQSQFPYLYEKQYGNDDDYLQKCRFTADVDGHSKNFRSPGFRLSSQGIEANYKMEIISGILDEKKGGVVLVSPESKSIDFSYVPDDPVYHSAGGHWDTPYGSWCDSGLDCGQWNTPENAHYADTSHFRLKDSVSAKRVTNIRMLSSNSSVIKCGGDPGVLSCQVVGSGTATVTARIPSANGRMNVQFDDENHVLSYAHSNFEFEKVELVWEIKVLTPDDLKEKIEIKLIDADADADGNINNIDYDSPPRSAIVYRIDGTERSTGVTDGKSPIIEDDVVAKLATAPLRITPPAIDGYTHTKTKFNCNGVITENMGTLKDGGSCTGIVFYSAIESNPPTAIIDEPTQGQEFILNTTTASAPQSSIFAKLWSFLKAKLAFAAPQSVATVTFRGHGVDNDEGDKIVAHRWYDRDACYDADGNYIQGCMGEIIHQESGVGVGNSSTFTRDYTEPGNYHVTYQVESQHFDGSGKRVGTGQNSIPERDPSAPDQVRFKITNPESPKPGECGTADKKEYGIKADFPEPYTLCQAGSLPIPEKPNFPKTSNAKATWDCQGSTTVPCEASRKSATWSCTSGKCKEDDCDTTIGWNCYEGIETRSKDECIAHGINVHGATCKDDPCPDCPESTRENWQEVAP